MNFSALVRKRKSTYEFSEKTVKDKDILALIEVARWAPSCTNTQPWAFIIVKDKERISELMKTVNYGNFHQDPPVIIAAVLCEHLCLGKDLVCFRGADAGTYDSFMSVGIAVEHMALQATELGIQSCLLTPEQKTAKKILNVRGKNAVPLLLGIGYEKKGAYQKQRLRRDIKEMIHYEKIDGELHAYKKK